MKLSVPAHKHVVAALVCLLICFTGVSAVTATCTLPTRFYSTNHSCHFGEVGCTLAALKHSVVRCARAVASTVPPNLDNAMCSPAAGHFEGLRGCAMSVSTTTSPVSLCRPSSFFGLCGNTSAVSFLLDATSPTYPSAWFSCRLAQCSASSVGFLRSVRPGGLYGMDDCELDRMVSPPRVSCRDTVCGTLVPQTASLGNATSCIAVSAASPQTVCEIGRSTAFRVYKSDLAPASYYQTVCGHAEGLPAPWWCSQLSYPSGNVELGVSISAIGTAGLLRVPGTVTGAHSMVKASPINIGGAAGTLLRADAKCVVVPGSGWGSTRFVTVTATVGTAVLEPIICRMWFNANPAPKFEDYLRCDGDQSSSGCSSVCATDRSVKPREVNGTLGSCNVKVQVCSLQVTGVVTVEVDNSPNSWVISCATLLTADIIDLCTFSVPSATLSPSGTESRTETATPIPSVTATETESFTALMTQTSSQSWTPLPTDSVPRTATTTSTRSSTGAATVTPSSTPTPYSVSASVTWSRTPVPTSTLTVTTTYISRTAVRSPSRSPTPSLSAWPTRSATASNTQTDTGMPTSSITATESITASISSTGTPYPTMSASATVSPSLSLLPTATPSQTLTITPQRTLTTSHLATFSGSLTLTTTRTLTGTTTLSVSPWSSRTTSPTSTPIPTLTPIATNSVTLSRTITSPQTSTTSYTSTFSPIPTFTLTPEVTASESPSSTATPSPSATPVPTATSSLSLTPLPTATLSQSSTYQPLIWTASLRAISANVPFSVTISGDVLHTASPSCALVPFRVSIRASCTSAALAASVHRSNITGPPWAALVTYQNGLPGGEYVVCCGFGASPGNAVFAFTNTIVPQHSISRRQTIVILNLVMSIVVPASVVVGAPLVVSVVIESASDGTRTNAADGKSLALRASVLQPLTNDSTTLWTSSIPYAATVRVAVVSGGVATFEPVIVLPRAGSIRFFVEQIGWPDSELPGTAPTPSSRWECGGLNKSSLAQQLTTTLSDSEPGWRCGAVIAGAGPFVAPAITDSLRVIRPVSTVVGRYTPSSVVLFDSQIPTASSNVTVEFITLSASLTVSSVQSSSSSIPIGSVILIVLRADYMSAPLREQNAPPLLPGTLVVFSLGIFDEQSNGAPFVDAIMTFRGVPLMEEDKYLAEPVQIMVYSTAQSQWIAPTCSKPAVSTPLAQSSALWVADGDVGTLTTVLCDVSRYSRVIITRKSITVSGTATPLWFPILIACVSCVVCSLLIIAGVFAVSRYRKRAPVHVTAGDVSTMLGTNTVLYPDTRILKSVASIRATPYHTSDYVYRSPAIRSPSTSPLSGRARIASPAPTPSNV